MCYVFLAHQAGDYVCAGEGLYGRLHLENGVSTLRTRDLNTLSGAMIVRIAFRPSSKSLTSFLPLVHVARCGISFPPSFYS